MEDGPLGSPSAKLEHSIHAFRLDLTVSREEGAQAMLETIGELNRSRLIPIVERVFDEFDRPGELIRIERISVDLGPIAAGDFGTLEGRLQDALREALREAVDAPSVKAGQGVSLHQALAEAVEHWLLTGLWPYGCGLGTGAAPAGLIARLIEESPGALAAVLLRCGHGGAVVERLFHNTPTSLLGRLVGIVAPDLARLLRHRMQGARTGLTSLQTGELVAEKKASSAAAASRSGDAPAGGRLIESMRVTTSNSGLVLTAPFLPRLFSRLELGAPDESGRFAWRSGEARGRAVHLLQWLADERCDAPEPMLALNKLLCGHPLAEPLLPEIEPTGSEIDICRSLLEAMIANWPKLSGSSVAALRETFLQREGCLAVAEEAWKLDVERKTLDVLLDSVPWSFSTIFLPWMKQPLAVAWR